MLQAPSQSGAVLVLASIFLGPVSDFFRRKRSTFGGGTPKYVRMALMIPHPIVSMILTPMHWVFGESIVSGVIHAMHHFFYVR